MKTTNVLFRRIWHACLYLALATAVPAGADFSGKVIGVLDGDTVDVLVNERPVRVRLSEIDAPEKRQAFGTRSRQALSAMVFGQSVTVEDQGLDWREKRTVGRILIAGRGLWADKTPVPPWQWRAAQRAVAEP